MQRDQKRPTRARVSGFAFVKQREYISEYVLRCNGLRVLYVHVEGSPTITTNILYHVGSQNEGRGETGLAHMLEHMLFKPTKGRAKVTWKDLEERGALLNATTWLDRTMYYFNLPKKYLADMLMVEADRMRNAKLIDKEFQPERTNVLSEYEMYNSRPEMALEWDMVSMAFKQHGYRHDTIGFRSDIEAYTPELLRKFYNRYYWPNNATLIVVGDIETGILLATVKKIFGAIPKGKERTMTASPEPIQEGVRRVELIRDTPIRVCSIAWRAPSFTERGWNALYLALLDLTDGKTSTLYRKLVEAKLATSVSGRILPTKDPFLVSIDVFASERGSYKQIEHVVFDALHELAKKGISNSRLKELKQHAYATELYSRDGTLSIASSLAEYVAAGDWERFFDGLDELRGVTLGEIKETVHEYLARSKSIVGTIEHTA